MPSPILHALAGAGITFAATGRRSLPPGKALAEDAPHMVAGAVLACLPDVDYVPGLLAGDLNRFHQLGTHSLVFCAMAALLFILILHRSRFTFRLILLLLLSHLLLDALTLDLREPVGFPLWWPFSPRPVHAPFPLFPRWIKDSPGAMLTWRNLRPALAETAWGAGIFAGCAAWWKLVPRRGGAGHAR